MLPSLKSVSRLVIRCPNWVGDIVMATPVFRCVRDNFPDTEIAALIRPYARGIIEGGPWFDAVIDCDDKGVSGTLRTRSSLRAFGADAALLLPNTTHSFITCKLAGIPRIYGYRRNLRSAWLTAGPTPGREGKGFKPVPMQDYYLELCRFLGLTVSGSPHVELTIPDEVAAKGARRLRDYGVTEQDFVIGLNPGASFGSSKCWPPEYFAVLAGLLQKYLSCKLLLLAGPGEEKIADAIVAQSDAVIINTAGDKIDLAELKPLVKRCDLLITNDTGPRHYAVAFGVPNIVLMGPTNPVYTARNMEHTLVLRRDLECSPCHKKVCPYRHHACMTEITPELVMQRTLDMLNQPAS
ncbi:MAG: lipopolysaccharide heptosyltransferase II [Pseudohongiellaceae bacterium]